MWLVISVLQFLELPGQRWTGDMCTILMMSTNFCLKNSLLIGAHFQINSGLLIHKNKMLINHIHSLRTFGHVFATRKHNSLTRMNALGFLFIQRFAFLYNYRYYHQFNHSSWVFCCVFACCLYRWMCAPLKNSKNRFINAMRCKQFSTKVAFAHSFIAINYTLPIELTKISIEKKNHEEFSLFCTLCILRISTYFVMKTTRWNKKKEERERASSMEQSR